MLKMLIIAMFTMVATTSMATPPPLLNCSCSITFGDIMSHPHDVTTNVTCPAAAKESLDCSAETAGRSFATTCANAETGEASTSSVYLDPDADTNYGNIRCSLY